MRDLPARIEGYGPLRRTTVRRNARPGKVLPTLDAAIAACGLKDGATVSFHHHLRNGDAVLNLVLDALARAGLRGLHVAATSIFPVHAPLVGHIRSGVVGRLSASFISGPVGEAISRGALSAPVILRSHGGRARAIDLGEVAIDAAFVAAPAADEMGNLSGRAGRAPCGTLGYPMVDVGRARHVVAVTDSPLPHPAGQGGIPQTQGGTVGWGASNRPPPGDADLRAREFDYRATAATGGHWPGPCRKIVSDRARLRFDRCHRTVFKREGRHIGQLHRVEPILDSAGDLAIGHGRLDAQFDLHEFAQRRQRRLVEPRPGGEADGDAPAFVPG